MRSLLLRRALPTRIASFPPLRTFQTRRGASQTPYRLGSNTAHGSRDSHNQPGLHRSADASTGHNLNTTSAPGVRRRPPVSIPKFGSVNFLAYDFCQRHGLAFSNELHRLRLPGRPKLPAQVFAEISTKHCFDSNQQRYFLSEVHPLTQSILDIGLAQHQKTPFWYKSARVHNAKPIVVRRIKSWLQRGMRMALEEEGFDRDGRKAMPHDAVVELYGTLRVTCSNALEVYQAGFPAVVETMKILIAQAISELARDQDGKYLNAGAAGAEARANRKTQRTHRSSPGTKSARSPGSESVVNLHGSRSSRDKRQAPRD